MSAQAAISAGATNLRTLTHNATVVYALQAAYAKAVTNTVYLAVAAACLCLPFAVFMEWKSVKPSEVSKEEGNECNDKDTVAELEKEA